MEKLHFKEMVLSKINSLPIPAVKSPAGGDTGYSRIA
ncbi:hypothetical protein J2S49_000292 [Arcanobacterium wilhelmae]|uniref:Uncharacterized protein n=1 Tax=Arcanobacterium wilhelmae TaxID=1803177 RepID=A0ABT9N940_9ACTO|nr:hypothetical protein [Arcanobacterium wilhelmae]